MIYVYFLCRNQLWENLYKRRGVRYILNLAAAEPTMLNHSYPIPDDLMEDVLYDAKVNNICIIEKLVDTEEIQIIR